MKKEHILWFALGIVAVYGVFLTIQHTNTIKEKEIQYVTLTEARDSLQIEKDSTIAQLAKAEQEIDNLMSINAKSDEELKGLKKQIRGLLYKGKITKKELKEAKALIVTLNTKIAEIVKENGELKAANTQLVDDKNQLTIEKNQLSKVLDSTREEKKKSDDLVQLGSTLSVSNVNASGINSKGKVTSVAEKVKKLRITFTVNENRITTSGKKTVHFILHNPLGNTIGKHGVVSTEDGELVCTGETVVDYTTGLIKDVSFDVPMDTLTVDGVYHIVLYENGKKISQKSLALKKKKILGFL